MAGVGRHAVAALDVRDNIANQVTLEGGGVFPFEAIGSSGGGMAVGHYDEHGDGLFVRDEIVENHVCAADGGPGILCIAASVQEEHYWEFRVRVFIVIGRSIDVERAGDAE